MNVNKIVAETNGRIFTVTFTKKDGSTRKMNCRTGVVKHLRGGTKTTPDRLITVYDVQNAGYRCFDPVKVTRIVAQGKVYER